KLEALPRAPGNGGVGGGGGGGPRVEEESAGSDVSLIALIQDVVSTKQETTTVKRVAVHPPNFLEGHKTSAASGALNCQGCHKSSECSQCHSGTSSARTYHPAD